MFILLVKLAGYLALTMICIPCLWLGIQIFYPRWKYRYLPCPPMKSFIFGHAWEISSEGEHISVKVAKWSKLYGSVFVLFLFNDYKVVCLEPNFVKDLLVTSNSPKPNQVYKKLKTLFGRRLIGSSLVAEVHNEPWGRRRKLLDPAFRRGYIASLIDHYNNSIDDFLSYIEQRADGKSEILMANELKKVSTDIIAKTVFSLHDAKIISNKTSKFLEEGGRLFAGVGEQIWRPHTMIDPRAKSRNFNKKCRDAADMFRTIARESIFQRIQDMKEGRECPKDILNHLLLSSSLLDDGVKDFGLESLIDELVTLFLAGQETTATFMSFTFDIIGRHPDVYKKVQNEVDTVLGQKEFITNGDIGKLEYLNLVVKEVLRLTPPATSVQRTLPRDTIINGYNISAGTCFMVDTYALGRDERFWDEPNKFNPDRFRENSTRTLYTSFPFSLGPRNCIGQHFARTEGKLLLAKFLQRYDFTLVPGLELDFPAALTLQPRHKTAVYVTPRDRPTSSD